MRLCVSMEPGNCARNVVDVRAPGAVLKFPRTMPFAIPVRPKVNTRKILRRIGVDSTQPRRQPVRPILARSARLMRGRTFSEFLHQQNVATPNRLERN